MSELLANLSVPPFLSDGLTTPSVAALKPDLPPVEPDVPGVLPLAHPASTRARAATLATATPVLRFTVFPSL